VCRVYNTSDISDPSFGYVTRCTRQLHPPLDLLRLIEEDIPDGAASDQYNDWVRLLNQTDGANILSDSHAAAVRARLVVASSALLILSVITSIALAVATLLIKWFYPYISLYCDIFDALLMIVASAMWTVAANQVTNAFTIDDGDARYALGAHTGPGFWILWAIAFTKLAVTPMLLAFQLKVVITVVMILIQATWICFVTCWRFMWCLLTLCPSRKVVVYEY
jgi:hypothetical protein